MLRVPAGGVLGVWLLGVLAGPGVLGLWTLGVSAVPGVCGRWMLGMSAVLGAFLALASLGLPRSLVNFSIPGYFSIFGSPCKSAGFLESPSVCCSQRPLVTRFRAARERSGRLRTDQFNGSDRVVAYSQRSTIRKKYGYEHGHEHDRD
jgi:hypothetical protein